MRIICVENAVASSKNNAGTSELLFGDEILQGLKVVGLQMILIGLRWNDGFSESFVRPHPYLLNCDWNREFWVLRMLECDEEIRFVSFTICLLEMRGIFKSHANTS